MRLTRAFPGWNPRARLVMFPGDSAEISRRHKGCRNNGRRLISAFTYRGVAISGHTDVAHLFGGVIPLAFALHWLKTCPKSTPRLLARPSASIGFDCAQSTVTPEIAPQSFAENPAVSPGQFTDLGSRHRPESGQAKFSQPG